MSGCGCGARVRYIHVGYETIAVDAQPHPAGIYAVRAVRRGIYIGELVAHDEAPPAGATRHRRHYHPSGD